MTKHTMDREAMACLAALRIMTVRRALLDKQITDTIKVARDHGAPWSAIGTGLGVSTQAAWERYRPESEHEPIAGPRALWDEEP